MYKSNVEFLRKQTEVALMKLYELSFDDTMLFHLSVDDSEKRELKTNMDEIMNFWVLPKMVGKEFSLSEITELLTTPKNEIPLWVKLSEVEKGRVYQMEISKRFRKLRVIKERHNDSEILPFLEKDN